MTTPIYAITLDIDHEAQRRHFGDDLPLDVVDMEVGRVLEKHGFVSMRGTSGIYFGGADAESCRAAVIDLARSLPWFAAAVRDARMLRIDEHADLLPAVRKATGG